MAAQSETFDGAVDLIAEYGVKAATIAVLKKIGIPTLEDLRMALPETVAGSFSPAELSRLTITMKMKSYNLPEELWSMVMPRLPVKSLLRFRCVCKAWRTQIDDLNFASTHLSMYRANSEGPNLLVMENVGRMDMKWIMRRNDTFKRTHDQPAKFYMCLFDVMGYLNGVLLIVRLHQVRKGQSMRRGIVLFNPSIRMYLRIEPLSQVLDRRKGQVIVGLGYDRSDIVGDDYKVVVISDTSDGDPDDAAAEVYSLKAGIWKSIDPPVLCSLSRRDLPLFLRGRIHWLGRMALGSGERFILTFNVREEVFNYIKYPKECKDDPDVIEGGHTRQSLIVLGAQDPDNIDDSGRRLAMLDIHSDHILIWVMQEYGMDESWMIFSRLDIKHHGASFVHQKKDGDLLLGRTPARGKEKACRKKGKDGHTDGRIRGGGGFGIKLYDVSGSFKNNLAERCPLSATNVTLNYVESMALCSEGEPFLMRVVDLK